jgi:hypothetical protein
LRRSFDAHTHAAGILAGIGMKYVSLKTQRRGVFSGLHLDWNHHVQWLAYQCGPTHATQRQGTATESNTQQYSPDNFDFICQEKTSR